MGGGECRPHARARWSSIPSYVETITIWAHPDVAGQNGARKLAGLLDARGVEVLVEGLS